MKYIVLKMEDVEKHCTPYGRELLQQAIMQVNLGRMEEGKGFNKYLVVNTDESYADEVKVLIEKNIGEKVTYD